MKKTFSIFIGKLLVIGGKIFHRGSCLPGTIAMKFNKNILKDMNLPNKIIAVTGSSGKGSTSKIIADVYKNMGYKVAYNDKGSNLKSAIITTLLENCDLKGNIKTDICVFEIDERYVKSVFPDIKPTHVVITNLTRDQPPRQAHFEFVMEEIKKGLNKDIHLILNGDDPFLQKFNLDNKYNVTYYGINKTDYSFTENKFNNLNISRCPKCFATLEYNFYHIEHLGDYKCPICGFKRPNISYEVTECNLKKRIITINDQYKINIENDMLFNVYNTLAAFTVLSINDLDKNKVCEHISTLNNNKKLYNTYKYKDRNCYVLNNKAENATTYNQSILYTHRDKALKTIVLGWKEISRRYKFDDISWLYDIDFELLLKDKIDKIICTGPQKYDLAVRLKYAGFDEKKIVVFDDLFDAEDTIKKSWGNIYAILNFDYLDYFNEIMQDESEEK